MVNLVHKLHAIQTPFNKHSCIFNNLFSFLAFKTEYNEYIKKQIVNSSTLSPCANASEIGIITAKTGIIKIAILYSCNKPCMICSKHSYSSTLDSYNTRNPVYNINLIPCDKIYSK